MTTLDYSRQSGAADIDVMRNSHIVQVGVGSGSALVKTLVRMGCGKLTCIDPDVVEFRNVTSQGFTFDDARLGRSKVEALRHECLAIDPQANVRPLRADFVRMSDAELKRILADATLLVMATDHHPAQARGALAGLVCDVPVILASIYRQGRAGEVIFQYPGRTKACYRCIARQRYEWVAQQHAAGRGNGTGNANGSLPFAPQLVDAIVGHLAIGMIHRKQGAVDNPFARWIDQLDQRNFLQTRMCPDYTLGGEDVFGDVFGHGEKLFCFDTIWQPGDAEVDAECPDCRGLGATPVGSRAQESTELEQLDCGTLVQQQRRPATTDGGVVRPARREPNLA